MNTLLETLSESAALQSLTDILFDVTLKGALVLALAALSTALLRRSSAAMRHWIWSLAFCSLLALPFLGVFAPSWQVTVPALFTEPGAVSDTETLSAIPPGLRLELLSPVDGPEPEFSLTGNPHTAGLPDTPLLAQPSERSGTNVPPAQAPGVAAPAPPTSDLSADVPWLTVLVLLWGLGAAFFFLRAGLGLLYAWWCARSSRPLGSSTRKILGHDCATQLNLDRPVRLRISSHVSTPMTFGVRRPTVLFPSQAAHWPDERMYAVLLHELAHVQRSDFLTNLLALCVFALNWHNPLAWMGVRHLRLERERACDDCVLLRGTDQIAYAEHLVDIARSLPRRPVLAPVTVGLAHKLELKERLQCILNHNLRRDPLSYHSILTSTVLTVSLLLPLATVKPEPPRTTKMPLQATHSTEALIAELASSRVDVKGHAAWLLGDRHEARATASLMKTLHDDDPEVRGMAAWALGEIRERAAAPPLLQALADEDDFAREMAVRALGKIKHGPSLCRLSDMTKDENTRVRYAAVWALGELGCGQALRAVAEALTDDNAHVANLAADILIKAPDSKTVESILKRTARTCPDMRKVVNNILDARQRRPAPVHRPT